MLNIDKKISINKVLIKRELEFTIWYLTDENEIKNIKKNVQTMNFIDINNVEEENECDIKIDITDFNYELISNSEITINMEYLCKCIAYTKKEIDLLSDFYGIDKSYKYGIKNINIEEVSYEKVKELSVNEKVLIDNINKLFDTDIQIKIKEKKSENGMVSILGNCDVRYIYNTFDNKNIEVLEKEFEFKVELAEFREEMIFDIQNSNFIILPDSSVDSKIEIIISRENVENKEICTLKDIAENIEDRNLNNHSMVIYFVKKGDTLWKIAKEFKVAVSRIVQMNEIEDEDKIYVGQKLYIAVGR